MWQIKPVNLDTRTTDVGIITGTWTEPISGKVFTFSAREKVDDEGLARYIVRAIAARAAWRKAFADGEDIADILVGKINALDKEVVR